MKKRKPIPLPKKAPPKPPTGRLQYKFGLLDVVSEKFPKHDQQREALDALVKAASIGTLHVNGFRRPDGGKPLHMFDLVAMNITGTIDLLGGLKAAMSKVQTGHAGLRAILAATESLEVEAIGIAQMLAALFPAPQDPPQNAAPKEQPKPEGTGAVQPTEEAKHDDAEHARDRAAVQAQADGQQDSGGGDQRGHLLQRGDGEADHEQHGQEAGREAGRDQEAAPEQVREQLQADQAEDQRDDR